MTVSAENNTVSLKQRAISLMDRIDNLLNMSEQGQVTKGGLPSKQTSSPNEKKEQAGANDLANITLSLGRVSKEVDALKGKIILLSGEANETQKAIKSLVSLGKQVASLQATVNKLLSQSAASEDPCDTPEGLAGEIPGCH